MTNGEMIQKVFNCEVCEPIMEEDIIHVIFPDKNDSAIGFDWSWWNMEYKEPTTKNDLGVDCISREQAIEEADKLCLETGYDNEKVIEMLNDLPSVTPQEPRKGHWINKQHLCGYCSAECSSCHKRSNGYVHDNGFSLVCTYYDFCPNCGSDNREIEEWE